jgi:hypothetical protein
MQRTRIVTAGLVIAAMGALSACGAASSSGASSAPADSHAAAGTPGRGAASTSGTSAASGASGTYGAKSSAGGAGSAAGKGTASGQPSPAADGLGASVGAAQAKIIKSGRIDLYVSTGADLRAAFARLTALGVGDGGFVASSSMQTGRHPSATITLRVPVATAPRAMSTIGAGHFGRVTAMSLTGRDVTGEVVEVGVEITNLTSEEKAVRVLLGKAGSVRNILTIQQELFQLQGEVQELTAQSNSLDNRVEYATVTVDLTTTKAPAPVVTAARHRSTAARFWRLASSHCVDAVRGVVLAIGWSAPLLIGLGVVAIGWLAWRRRRRPHTGVAA